MPDTRGSLQTQSIRNPILFSLGYGYEVLQNTWIDHAQTTDNDYANNFVSIPGEGKRKDIIYIFAESFSPIDSKKFGGKNNYFKQTDASVASGIYMPNLYAAGCVSEHAHISFLQGIFPIDYTLLMRKPDEYLPYKTYTDPLPLFMKRQGYDISFIGSAPLSFLHQGRYIESMGFSSGNIYGDDKFSQYKKYAFWSAPDKIMVKQLLDFYTQRKKSKKPIFMVGQTITSHLPYNNSPYGTRESDSRKYADDAIGDLIVGLQKKKFFKNGILIIVGDHRKMLKITQEEITRFGQSANAKVVGSIMGSGIDPDTVYSGIVQNPDIHYALKQMVATGNVWVWKDYNNPLTNVTNRNRGINVCRFQDKRIKVLYPDGKAERMPQVPSLLLKPIYTFIESFKNFQYQTVVKENVQTILSGALQPLSGVTIIGHAGTNKNTTRNSIEAFLLALRQGADGLEMDVSYTQDKKLVIYHGRTMSSTICGSGMNVDQLTFEYIRTHCPLKNGENIPTFDEGMKILQYIAPWMIVEIKVLDKNLGPAMLKDVLAVVNTYNLKHKAMIITYDETLRKELDILTGYRVGRDTYARSDVGIVDGDNYEFIMMPFDQITGYEQIKKYKREKKRFMTYTPQTDKDLISTFRRGAREFIVDDIPWARKVLQRELDS